MSASAMQRGHKKTKARFSRLLQNPAWKWIGPILFRRFIYLSLTYLHRHLPTYLQPRDPHRATVSIPYCNTCTIILQLAINGAQ